MNAWSKVCLWALMVAWLPMAQPALAAGDSGAAAGLHGQQGRNGVRGLHGQNGQHGLHGHLASVDWLKANLARTDVVLIDASPAPLHRQQHIPGAILSTLFTFGPKDLPQDQFEAQLRAWGVNPGQHIVLYDQGGTYMATRLFWDLVHHGLPADRLLILDGGLAKWQALGGAVTKEATPKPVPGTIRLSALDQTVRVRLPEFLVATGDPERNVLLEALEPSYFFGGAAFFNRGGHVPHATLMPSTDFFNADKTFKSPPEIQRMLDHQGIRRDQQIHTYCGGGGAAAVPFFALKYLLDYPPGQAVSRVADGLVAGRARTARVDLRRAAPAARHRVAQDLGQPDAEGVWLVQIEHRRCAERRGVQARACAAGSESAGAAVRRPSV